MRAVELKAKGWKQQDIAEALGVSKGAVSQWLTAAQEGGPEALGGRKGGGPKPRLSDSQVNQLPQVLQPGVDTGAGGQRHPARVWSDILP